MMKSLVLGVLTAMAAGSVSGLKPDETVVSNGAFKVRNGMPVQVKPDVAPAQLAPTPTDR